MKIVAVSSNFCVRATQSCLAAKAVGHQVFLLVQPDAGRRQLNQHFDGISLFNTEAQLDALLRELKPDLIHVHDRPHAIPVLAMKHANGVPVVHDVHDMFSRMVPGGQAPEDSPYEKASILGAQGLVFVSQPNLDYAAAKYGVLPPAVVVRSAVYSTLFPVVRLPRLAGAVWGGGIYLEPPQSPRFYIDQREIARRFIGVGIPASFHYPPTDPPILAAYADTGAVLCGERAYIPLLQEFGRYDFGWYGQVCDHPQIHDTLPNKMFEYIAAGLPVVAINAREAGKYLTEHGLGIHIRRPEDVVYHLDELRQMRQDVWERRWAFTRERECEALWPLYEKLTGKPGKPNVK